MRPRASAAADDDDDEDPSFADNNFSDDEEPQDDGVRRQIRNDLRSIQTQATRNRTELLTGDTDELKKTLEETNKIFENVKHCREAVLDAQVMLTIAEVAVEKANACATDLDSFNSIEFTEKLITFVGGGGVEDEGDSFEMSRDVWIALGKGCHQYFKRSPPLHFMFGSFTKDPAQKKQKPERQIHPKDKDSLKAATAPKQVTSLKDMEKKEATTVEVERIYGILKDVYVKNRKHPVCYFEFVVNPESFGQTVENIFYTSFLIRDGHCRFQLDADKLPTIEPVERLDGDVTVSELPHHQFVMSMTIKDWQDIVREFDIETPIIKTRRRIQPDRSINGSQPSASTSNSSVHNPPSKKSKQDDARHPSTSRGNRSVWQSMEDISKKTKNRNVEPDSD